MHNCPPWCDADRGFCFSPLYLQSPKLACLTQIGGGGGAVWILPLKEAGTGERVLLGVDPSFATPPPPLGGRLGPDSVILLEAFKYTEMSSQLLSLRIIYCIVFLVFLDSFKMFLIYLLYVLSSCKPNWAWFWL